MDMHMMGERATETTVPLLSPAALQRLRFLAYRRQTGRIQPPWPVSSEVDALCTALLRNPAPSASTQRVPPTRNEGRRAAYYGGLPAPRRVWARRPGPRQH